MKNKGRFILMFIIFISLILHNLSAQEIYSTENIYIFLIDLSGSMKKDALSERVKIELENFIRDEVEPNDRLLIVGFGDEVTYYWDDVLTEMKEKEIIYNKISNLVSNHSWTHMSAAFDHLAKRLNELNQLYPESIKYIYIFTDGKNEPPKHLNENPELFSEILEKHFGENTLKPLKSFIYYITFGTKAPEEITQISEESDNFKVTEKPRKEEIDSKPIIPIEIELKIRKDSYKLIKGKREEIELRFKAVSITKSAEIKVDFEDKEKIVSLSKKNKKFDIIFSPNNLSEGNHNTLINVSTIDDNGKITPEKFEITYRVIIPDYTIWYILGALLLLIVILLIIYKMLPTFSGRLIFIKNDSEYPQRLSGKFCKKLSDLQRGWGIPVSIKVCPDSTGSRVKLKFKLTEKKRNKFTKNGLVAKKSPIILRTGDSIEYGDVKVQFDNNKRR